jgi:16S rRNA G966 N2-methylase RsmD
VTHQLRELDPRSAGFVLRSGTPRKIPMSKESPKAHQTSVHFGMPELSGRKRVEEALRRAFATHPEASPRALAEAAIAAAFRQSDTGRAYFFVFTASLDTTNAALAELISVVRRRLQRAEGIARGPFAYWDLDAYTSAVAVAVEHVGATLDRRSPAPPTGDLAQQLMQNYQTLFLDSVVIQPLKCSCSVLVPADSLFDLAVATRDASYVYCSGQSIFTRSVKRARDRYVDEQLQLYLGSFTKGEPLHFVPFCHEDFSKSDRDAVKFCNGALDDIKIDLEKAFFGSTPVVEWLARQPNNQLTVIDSDHYERRRANVHITSQGTSLPPAAGSVWLITDSAPVAESHSATKYYVCYHQLFRKRDPFALFDENKPGWIEHVTLPHSLTGALLSIAAGQLAKPIRVLDPFAGTCTTLFECGKRPELIKSCLGVEKFKGAQRVFDHNVEYFTREATRSEVSRMLEELEKEEVTWKTLSEYGDDDAFEKALAEKTMSNSVRIYLARRVAKRARRAIDREPNQERHDQIAQRRWSSEIYILRRQAELAGPCYGDVARGQPAYSPEVTARLDEVALSESKLEEGLAENVLKRLKEEGKRFDLILTDPPYSINHGVELDALVAEVFGLCLDLLVEGGLLIVVLPFATFNGQPFSPIVAPHMVRQLLLLEGEKRKRTVYSHFELLQGTSTLLKDGIYWRSRKLLERRAMVFGVNGAPP